MNPSPQPSLSVRGGNTLLSSAQNFTEANDLGLVYAWSLSPSGPSGMDLRRRLLSS